MSPPSNIFKPDDNERTIELENLFRKIDLVIANHLQMNDDLTEDKVRRFVTYHLCQDMYNTLEESFMPPSRPNTTPWTCFLKEEYKTYSDRQKARGEKVENIRYMQRAVFKKKYYNIKENKPEEFVRLEEQAKELNEAKPTNFIHRKNLYDRDLKKLDKSLSYMYRNYDMHFILAYAHDTTKDRLFPSRVIKSKGNSIYLLQMCFGNRF